MWLLIVPAMERNLCDHFHHKWVCWQKYDQNSTGMWPIVVGLLYMLAYSFVLVVGVPVNTYWFDLEL